MATEGGHASLRYAFEVLELDEVVSISEPDNVASGRVARRLGMQPVLDTTHPTLGVPLTVHKATAAMWRSTRH